MRHKDIRRECEKLWAKNKYYILSKSQKIYLEIREYLKEKELDVIWVNEKIQETRDMKESKKDFRNAILHIWGYFKKNASTFSHRKDSCFCRKDTQSLSVFSYNKHLSLLYLSSMVYHKIMPTPMQPSSYW